MENNNNREGLFSEFPPVSTEQWEARIIADLKGGDYDKKLVWHTDEGFDVKPYYRGEDLNALDYLRSLPGEEPYVRGFNTQGRSWTICQDIPHFEPEASNKLAIEAVARGAQGIGLNFNEISSHSQLSLLLKDLPLSEVSLHIKASRSYPLSLELLIAEINHRGIATEHLEGSLNFDPIGYLLHHGDFYGEFRNNMEEAVYLLNTAAKHLPSFRTITVNGSFYRNAGSTIVQELAFSLAHANEYLSALTTEGVAVNHLAPGFVFNYAIGPSYFLEIARLRAARILWSLLLDQYQVAENTNHRMFIHAVSASWNKSLYDPYVNILRTTTEGMAAALGNADCITLGPFDQPYRNPDEFSLRIARNQQLILREEAYLDKVADPAAGSYYIENLTDAIARHAWDLFREVESRGGLITGFKSGYIQSEIKRSRQQKEADIAQRKVILLGTNQYPNLQEEMLDKIRIPEPANNDTAASYEKLIPYRIAGSFDHLRLQTERFVAGGNKRPTAFLLTMGNLAMLRARAGFATNFLGCAGFEVIDNPGFPDIDEAIKAALDSKAEMVVICSSDEEYPLIVPGIASGLKEANPRCLIILAGYPKEHIELFRAQGVDAFIHVRSNLISTLTDFQKHLQIQVFNPLPK